MQSEQGFTLDFLPPIGHEFEVGAVWFLLVLIAACTVGVLIREVQVRREKREAGLREEREWYALFPDKVEPWARRQD